MHREVGVVGHGERDAKHLGIDAAYQHHEPQGCGVEDVGLEALDHLDPLRDRMFII